MNDILGNPDYTRRINDFVICSWVRDDPDLSVKLNGVVLEPTEDAVRKFFEATEKGQRFETISDRHFHSLTLAANGGRVVVRRWLDLPLGEVVEHVKTWFRDLELELIPSTKFQRPNYRSIPTLASTTARTSGDVRSEVYDALYRAAFERRCPSALLPLVLNRLRIEATRRGGNLRYQTERFALIKLILNRMESSEMTIEPQLCQTHDAPYNCGRLLAVLDDLQSSALGDVGADVVARYYGNASTFPRNVFPRLLRLARAHLNKLEKMGNIPAGKKKYQARAKALSRKINEICALFPCGGSGSAAEFPGQLDTRAQGRFALGFYQQKAKDQRERDARKAAGEQPADDPEVE